MRKEGQQNIERQRERDGELILAKRSLAQRSKSVSEM